MADMEHNRGWDEGEDFYEDDEPLEKIVAAYSKGEKFVTEPPAVTIETRGLAAAEPVTGGVHVAVQLTTTDLGAVRPMVVIRSAA